MHCDDKGAENTTSDLLSQRADRARRLRQSLMDATLRAYVRETCSMPASSCPSPGVGTPAEASTPRSPMGLRSFSESRLGGCSARSRPIPLKSRVGSEAKPRVTRSNSVGAGRHSAERASRRRSYTAITLPTSDVRGAEKFQPEPRRGSSKPVVNRRSKAPNPLLMNGSKPIVLRGGRRDVADEDSGGGTPSSAACAASLSTPVERARTSSQLACSSASGVDRTVSAAVALRALAHAVGMSGVDKGRGLQPHDLQTQLDVAHSGPSAVEAPRRKFNSALSFSPSRSRCQSGHSDDPICISPCGQRPDWLLADGRLLTACLEGENHALRKAVERARNEIEDMVRKRCEAETRAKSLAAENLASFAVLQTIPVDSFLVAGDHVASLRRTITPESPDSLGANSKGVVSFSPSSDAAVSSRAVVTPNTATVGPCDLEPPPSTCQAHNLRSDASVQDDPAEIAARARLLETSQCVERRLEEIRARRGKLFQAVLDLDGETTEGGSCGISNSVESTGGE